MKIDTGSEHDWAVHVFYLSSSPNLERFCYAKQKGIWQTNTTSISDYSHSEYDGIDQD